MNILIVSECTKAALTETRRILDQFAERRGERTWQTAITAQGLQTLRSLLRKSARKNTAVACHWVRGKDHTELLWVVGNAHKFNAQGAVPTNISQRNVLRLSDENDWHNGQAIYVLSSFAALLHDLGKACDEFQQRLKKRPDSPNLYRHEWISLRLFQAFVGSDDDATWLARFANLQAGDIAQWLSALHKDGLAASNNLPFSQLPPLAAAIGWLVVSHHRLPEPKQVINADTIDNLFLQIDAQSNQKTDETDPAKIKPYWSFQHGLPVAVATWQNRAQKLAQELQKLAPTNWLDNLYVMHLSRLVLMLADHHYSSLSSLSERKYINAKYPLMANTDRETGKAKQTLDEHLLGVTHICRRIAHALPDLERALPRLQDHKGMRKRATIERFTWQNKAFDLMQKMRSKSQAQGAFIINMASTGCGKTLANARMMYALAEPDVGARFNIALGLRTLTLQTGREYQSNKLHLADDLLAIRVGGAASTELFEKNLKEAEKTGSASSQDLAEEDFIVHYEGDFQQHPLLSKLSHNPSIKALIAAPVLVCTVDHLIPATESTRGGQQIAPMLRLMSSDLVLDEIDDYGMDDLPALARLVHWAGLLGSRVMLSSATLPPALVQGLFSAYLAGRAQFQANRGQVNSPVDVCCAWVDENSQQATDCADLQLFSKAHQAFVAQRVAKLEQQVNQQLTRRKVQIAGFTAAEKPTDITSCYVQQILQSAYQLHADNHHVPANGIGQVSFGLVRMANIQPLVDVALALFQQQISEDTQLHLCVYHSQYPLLMRSNIEKLLDNSLNRRDPQHIWQLPMVCRALAQKPKAKHLFIVLGSPVTEVGRDHDYDWAIVEPSSMRSLIQLAGRVRRHRPEAYLTTNIHWLTYNVKGLTDPASKPVFNRPGFESEKHLLHSHNLQNLVTEDEYQFIHAGPRISARAQLLPEQSLVDLEHYCMQQMMLVQQVQVKAAAQGRKKANTPAKIQVGPYVWWLKPRMSLLANLQRKMRFRAQTIEQEICYLLLNDEQDACQLHKFSRETGTFTLIEQSLKHDIEDSCLQHAQINFWHTQDLFTQMEQLAEELDKPLADCCLRYSQINLPKTEQGGWRYHPQLGFSKAT